MVQVALNKSPEQVVGRSPSTGSARRKRASASLDRGPSEAFGEFPDHGTGGLEVGGIGQYGAARRVGAPRETEHFRGDLIIPLD